jgi:hypothetical protein
LEVRSSGFAASGFRSSVLGLQESEDMTPTHKINANLGAESAAEIRAKTPSDTYPSGPYFPEAQTAWDALNSNATEIRRLLREYPEL